ncbi:MAG: Fic family protein [Candidatus Moranbacteria bacterium]|jgi:Fic family protein|nr:Fic family protein [Candidatus Moranbacteria bacterium]NCA93599.1 cell filamentation protein Fic [Sphingobacteriia bacterium]
MHKLKIKQQKIIKIFLEKGRMQSSQLHEELRNSGEDISLVTVKRALSELTEKGILEVFGLGRSTSYQISAKGRVLADIDAKEYVAVEPDKRFGLNQYNFDLLSNFPVNIFTEEELKRLEVATDNYKKRTADISATIQKKELERLVIELSWKSSRIEGNTYTLLDTEKLILENKEAPGHSKNEARMILNHKDAFNYIRSHASQFQTITRKNLEELHSIIINDLNVSMGFRSGAVGITGSIYRPLDNIYQIAEAVENLSRTVSQNDTPYARALLALLGISYIQPFEDGNKRTSRLMANALLVSHALAPLSYRSVDEEEYKSAVLVFYELNSIVPMKKIFIEQYEFATENYAVK